MFGYISSFIWGSSNTVEPETQKSGLDVYIRSKNVNYFSYTKDSIKINHALISENIYIISRYDEINSQITNGKQTSSLTERTLCVPVMTKLKIDSDELISYVDSIYCYVSIFLGRNLHQRESEILCDRLKKLVDDGAPIIHATAAIPVRPVSELQQQLNKYFGINTDDVIVKEELKLIEDFNERREIIQNNLKFRATTL